MNVEEVTKIPEAKAGLKEMSETTKELMSIVKSMVVGRIYKIVPSEENFKKTSYSLITVKKKFPTLKVTKRGKELYLKLE